MKLCSISNYTHKGYINEFFIYNKLSSLLGIGIEDSFNFYNPNIAYTINKNYTHLLVYFDYKTTSIQGYDELLSEIKIPKIFIIDTIPPKHEEINKEFIDTFLKNNIYSFTCLSKNLQEILYKKHANGIILFSDKDKNLFEKYYIKTNNIPKIVIPPSLGKEKEIKINYNNFSPNKLLGYNGVPSYANGFTFIGNALNNLPELQLSVFGTHGRTDLNNELLINDILEKVPNVKFRGRLKNYNKFFKLYHIYPNLSIYDSFDYFTFKSLLNGMVPLLTKNTGTSSYFQSYPFICSLDDNSIKYNLELILKTPPNYLKEILDNIAENLRELSDEKCLSKYQTFIKNI